MGFRIKIRDGKVVSSSGDTSNSIAQKFIKKHTSSSSSSSSGGSSRSSSSSSGGSSRSSSKSSSPPKLVGTTDKGKRIYEKSGEKYTIDQKTGKNITYKEPSKSKKEEAPKTDVFSKARGGQSFLSSRVSSSKGIKSGVYEPLTSKQAKKVKDKPKGLKEAIKKEETRTMVFEKPGKSTFYREIKEEPSKSATPKKEKPKPISLSQSVAEKSPLTQTEKSFTNKIDSRRMSVAKDTYGSALLRESKERYKPLFNLAKEGFKKIGQEASTFFTKPTESFKITGKKGKKARDTFEIVSRNISGATRSRAAFMSTPEFRTQSARKILTFIDPEIEKAKDITKSDWADYRKGITTSSVLRQEFQAPGGKEKLAGATLTAAELVGPEVALSKIPRFAKSSYYKTFGKYIEPDKIYSTKALESPSGLDLSFNPYKTTTKFRESQKVAKGTPLEGLYSDDYMIGISSTGDAFKSTKILGKSDLGEPVNETGGLFISPLASGQPRFLRLGKQDTYTKFSLNPFSAAQTETPQAYAVGVKKVQEFPKRLLRKDESVFSDIEAFQKSRVGRSESYITRESSLGIKKEPEAVLNVGDEFSKLGTRPIYTT